jgi:2-polyprenyl-3-methyl-5-hydroxy-6-metoxy-1,4-benzoquinol methylase/uncharacterized protein YbaR (Trm112 family)
VNRKILDWLACPVCHADLAQEGDDAIVCSSGHAFPVVDGVPGLIPDGGEVADAARSIRESFGREWSHFDYGRDRTWGYEVEERREHFLRQLDLSAEELEGKLVLDAGCGNGALSVAMSTLGCEVVAADIGAQVYRAHAHFATRGGERTHFVHADLMRPPFKPDTYDVVFSGGVLHHTPDTRATFERVLPALAPGGTVFVWLYHHVPGFTVNFKLALRKWISRMPAPVKHAIVKALLPQSMLRQSLRIRRGKQDPATRLNRHEKLITMLDSFTCRWRWEHTPEELAGWYREHGFNDIKTTELGPWGFGVMARRPPVAAPAVEDPVAVGA